MKDNSKKNKTGSQDNKNLGRIDFNHHTYVVTSDELERRYKRNLKAKYPNRRIYIRNQDGTVEFI